MQHPNQQALPIYYNREPMTLGTPRRKEDLLNGGTKEGSLIKSLPKKFLLHLVFLFCP
jgi:hypothetical protein